jgi:Protein of unknown function (DUF2924)
VTVRDEDFEYQGRPYKSLSAIVRAITGTRWNGLVFFEPITRAHVAVEVLRDIAIVIKKFIPDLLDNWST